jgi:mRNA interferase RelE/StbE
LSLNVIVKEPVYEFARRLAPEPRHAVKQALKALRTEDGDIRALERTLTGYYRLRIGKFRLIFRYVDSATIEAVFLEERDIVYEVFESQFLRALSRLGRIPAAVRDRRPVRGP